jgi:hypothetical protein
MMSIFLISWPTMGRHGNIEPEVRRLVVVRTLCSIVAILTTAMSANATWSAEAGSPKDMRAHIQDFLEAMNNCVFSTEGNIVSREGAPLDYREDKLLWLNALRGGHATSDYPYFMFRPPRNRDGPAFDIVCFNSEGIGFYVPITAPTASGPMKIGFSFQRRTGGGEAAIQTEDLHFTVSWEQRPPEYVRASIVSVAKSRQWLIFAWNKKWSATMVLPKTTAPPEVIEEALVNAVPFPGSFSAR